MPQTATLRPGTCAPSVFLSPHYDDVALSCGGTVALLADAGCKPLLVTVFAGDAPEELVGRLAAQKHSRWGADTATAVLTRRRTEDAAAMAVLGCRTRQLGFPEAIYRGGRYCSDQGLYGTPDAAEEELAGLIAAEVRQAPEWRPGTHVYVPLAIGKHVDHQLTFLVGRRLAAQGVPVFAYEDCPYAIHTPTGVERRLAEVGDQVAAPALVPVSATVQRRLDAIAAYRSQVPVIFRFTDDFRAAVTDHATRQGEGTPCERYWPVLPPPARAVPPANARKPRNRLPSRVAVLRLEGALDMETADAVQRRIAALFQEGHDRVVVDLGKVLFMDSSGLGCLVCAYKAARLRGGDLRLARVLPQARTLLKLTALDSVFKCSASVEEACAGFADRQAV